MIFKAIFTGALSLLGTALATVYPTPPDVLYPTTTWVKKSGKSKMGHINAPFTAADGSSDNVHMYRLDLVGTDYERGYAHGALLSKEILEFVEIALPKYYVAAVMSIDVRFRTIIYYIYVFDSFTMPAANTRSPCTLF